MTDHLANSLPPDLALPEAETRASFHDTPAFRLPDRTDATHTEARSFCLSVIKEAYGFDYRPDWHADLDSLLQGEAANHYAAANRGAFWLVRGRDGQPVATVGIKRLDWQVELSARLAPRYPRLETVATVARAYVRADRRGQGFGGWLSDLCVAEAPRLGYRTLYLHTNDDAEAAMRFWRSRGWREFDRFGISTHFDRDVTP